LGRASGAVLPDGPRCRCAAFASRAAFSLLAGGAALALARQRLPTGTRRVRERDEAAAVESDDVKTVIFCGLVERAILVQMQLEVYRWLLRFVSKLHADVHTDTRSAATMWEVSEVTSVQIPTGFGSGFNVTTDRGRRPLVLFVYETQAEAEAARGQIAAAIERALLVQPFAPVM
jgi:hypothetical protein